jgi:hypothetical protein
MEQPDIIHHELMYEAEIQFTGIVEYGVSIEALSMAETPIPLAGARFDQTFEGTLAGPRLRGKIHGTDYLYVRPDGLFQLHLHAQVTTEDGTNLAMSSEGVSLQVEGEKLTQLRAAVSLFTASSTTTVLYKMALLADNGGNTTPLEG